MYRVWDFVANYSLLLIIGAIAALIWANTDAVSYHHFVEYPLWFNNWIGFDYGYWASGYGSGYQLYEIGDVDKVLSLRYLVNDMLMALFFAVAFKEVWEAVILKNGALRGRKAATPLIATFGGVAGAAVVYLGLATLMGSDTYDAVANGWAVPTATDIALSYIVGRIVFGAGHSAVRFLLLLAIADDALGLIILAVFYPSADFAPAWLLLSVLTAVGVYLAFNLLPRVLDRDDRDLPVSSWVRRKLHFIPYLIAGCISWFGVAQSGLNPALGLLPIVATIPHADRAFGLFSEAEQYLTDLLNRIQHALKHPVEVILFLFGLMNAGVALSFIGDPTWIVMGAMLLGKPLGIVLFGWFAARVLGLGLPERMRVVDLVVIGFVASIGLTMSLFFASVAFEPGPVQDAAKTGALFSIVAAIIAVIAGLLFRVERQRS